MAWSACQSDRNEEDGRGTSQRVFPTFEGLDGEAAKTVWLFHWLGKTKPIHKFYCHCFCCLDIGQLVNLCSGLLIANALYVWSAVTLDMSMINVLIQVIFFLAWTSIIWTSEISWAYVLIVILWKYVINKSSTEMLAVFFGGLHLYSLLPSLLIFRIFTSCAIRMLFVNPKPTRMHST